MTKEDLFCSGAHKILVVCDAKSMAAFLEQDFKKTDNPPMPYNIEVRYVPGKKMEVSDIWSRHPILFEDHEPRRMVAGLTKLVLYDQIRGLRATSLTEKVAVYLVSHHTRPILYAIEDMFI